MLQTEHVTRVKITKHIFANKFAQPDIFAEEIFLYINRMRQQLTENGGKAITRSIQLLTLNSFK
ncbi:MAG: hypothetical protein C0613_14220 [Desulfobulbaceae bacterium]|nr:MAG: hypothetical protein C0613_14220 [Desulfobulbaceae bacterium]